MPRRAAMAQPRAPCTTVCHGRDADSNQSKELSRERHPRIARIHADLTRIQKQPSVELRPSRASDRREPRPTAQIAQTFGEYWRERRRRRCVGPPLPPRRAAVTPADSRNPRVIRANPRHPRMFLRSAHLCPTGCASGGSRESRTGNSTMVQNEGCRINREGGCR